MKKQEASKDVAVKQETSLAVVDDFMGASDDYDMTDLIIPKILHQQGLSKFVSAGKSRAGDFCDSVDGRVLGNNTQPVELIIFKMFKTWVVFCGDKGEEKFSQVLPALHQKEFPWEEITPEGQRFTRNFTYNFYCLIPGEPLPFLLALSRTSTKAAKGLLTLFARLKAMGRGSASKVFLLGGHTEQNDNKQTYHVADITAGRDTTPEERELAKSWHNTICGGTVNVVVDNSDLAAPQPGAEYLHTDDDIPF